TGWDQTANTCASKVVAAGATVTCQITNAKRGHLIVTKVTDPSSDTTTQFGVTASGNGTISGNAVRTLTGNNSSTDYEVTPGTYSVAETTVPTGWDQTANTCASKVVAAGATVTCQITNAKRGHLIVTKVTDPSSDTTTQFEVNANGNGTIKGDAAENP